MHDDEQRQPPARGYIAPLSLLIAASAFVTGPSLAREGETCQAPEQGQETLWTVVIPDRFPGYIYTWRLKRGELPSP